MSVLLKAFLACLLFSLPIGAYAIDDAKNFDRVIDNLIARGDSIIADYQPQQALSTSDQLSRLYFDQFESSGLEFRLSAVSTELTAQLELGFGGLIHAALKGVEANVLATQWSQVKSHLAAIPSAELNHENWLGTYLQSLIILLREGVEAMLLLALLMTLLTRGGHGDKVWLIWAGAGSALVASIATAYALQRLIDNAGPASERMEGTVLLLAAGLLLYVSLWIVSQQEAGQWQQSLQQKILNELEYSNQIAIFLMAFVAVFREGAETLLFYQALIIETQNFGDALWSGAASAGVLLIGFYFTMHKFARRVRLSYFFKATSILLFLMAISLIGKGVMELQVSGLISINTLQGIKLLPAFGVFNTVESLASQLLAITLYCLILAALYLARKPRHQQDT